jgi:F0F1-type ATP synthase membrane subunit c/vacuolar-type H+-ATPase subunit K
MATQRTLKLNLLADVDKFGKNMKKAGTDTTSFGNKVSNAGKRAAKGLAGVGVAAGIMATKLGVDAVQAAAEDEKSQKKLSTALKNTTNATDDQVAAVETWITTQQLALGVSDNELRPAFANLARATGSVTEAQNLLTLALDISAATGKDVETVSLGLSRAYNGNLGALTRLGVPLDQNTLKTKDFDAAASELTRLFGGSAKANTETLAGKLAILQETFGELQEGVGQKLIPKLKNLVDIVLQVSRAFSGEDPDGLSTRARELKGDIGDGGAGSLGRSLKILADSFGALFKSFTDDGDDATDGMQEVAGALVAVANGINAVARAYKKAKEIGGNILDFLIIGEGGLKFADTTLGKKLGYTNRAAGGSVMPGQAYKVGEFGSEIFVPSGSGSIRKDNTSGGNTFIFNGVIDGESARRSIERVMQNSTLRTGAVNLAGSPL